ncbi:MAG: hypothetical protein JHC93_08805, partial [Parachlamydiales bacterium]|nr:hypothetical protein [Parachlamydiales bacterium]
ILDPDFTIENELSSREFIYKLPEYFQDLFFKKNIELNEVNNSINLLKNILDKEITQLQPELSNDELLKKIRCVVERWETEIYDTVFDIHNISSFNLDKSDFDMAEMPFDEYKNKEKIPTCFDYAFYKLNVYYLKSYIFSTKCEEAWPDWMKMSPVAFLKNHDFYPSYPPVAGDLVVYLDKLDRATHMGIWTSQKVVRSKWGRQEVCDHPVNHVLNLYGVAVQFFHKNIPTLLQKNLCDKLLDLKLNWASDTDNIFNIEHFKTSFIKMVDQMPITHTFKNSLYNVTYCENLKLNILSKISQIASDTLPKAFQEIQQTINTAHLDIPINI